MKQQHAKIRLATPHSASSLIGVAWMCLKSHRSSSKRILKDGSFLAVIVGALELDYSSTLMDKRLLITRCILSSPELTLVRAQEPRYVSQINQQSVRRVFLWTNP